MVAAKRGQKSRNSQTSQQNLDMNGSNEYHVNDDNVDDDEENEEIVDYAATADEFFTNRNDDDDDGDDRYEQNDDEEDEEEEDEEPAEDKGDEVNDYDENEDGEQEEGNEIKNLDDNGDGDGDDGDDDDDDDDESVEEEDDNNEDDDDNDEAIENERQQQKIANSGNKFVISGTEEPCTFDLRNLLAMSSYPIDSTLLYNRTKTKQISSHAENYIVIPPSHTINEEYLLQKSMDGCNQLITALWQLPIEGSDAGPMVVLPSFDESKIPRKLVRMITV
jgi:hypothetical protein